MPIEAIVTGNPPITASVGETKVDVSVSSGIGPTGPAGTTSWSGITDIPAAFSPSAHAQMHAIGGVDYVSPAAIGAATIAAAESLQLQVDGKAASSHTHPASAITSGTINASRLPLATPSIAGAIVVGTGLSVSSGVASVSWGSSSTTSCRGDDSRLSDSREWSASTVTQVDAEAGTATDRKAFTVQRVWQAIAAWWAGSAAKTKLDGIEAGATANATDAQLRDRSTHTGTQTASTISDFTSAVVAAAPPTTDASLLTSGMLPDARLSGNIARTSDVTSAVAAVVDASPASLDTLRELATALGNDASFATTVTNSLAAKAPINNPTFTGTVGGVTKSMVGLGNVDNTSDANKPISTATQAALDGKASATDSRFTDQRTPIDGSVTAAKIAANQSVAFRSTVLGGSGGGGSDNVAVLTINNLANATTMFVTLGGVIANATWNANTIGLGYGGTGATTASGARANLELGSLATKSTVAWSTDITGIPSTFSPSAHSHAISDVTDLATTLSGKAAASHTHGFTQVTDDNTYTNFLPEGGSLATALSGIDSAITARALASDFDQGVKTTDDPTFNTVNALYGGTLVDDQGGAFSLVLASNGSDSATITVSGVSSSPPYDPASLVITAFGISFSNAVTFDGTYDSLGSKPTLGTAAAANTGDFAAVSHTHSASDVTSGTLDIARIPTGTSSTTVSLGNHTHSQLHDRSHAITSTSDHTAGNWKVFHSNGSGQLVEVALGAANTVLTSNGASSAPTFTAPAVVTKSFVKFTPADNQPPASNYATLDTRNSVLVLEFDAATQESAVFCGVIPESVSVASGLKVSIWWMGDTATSGNVRWGVSFEATGTDMDSDSFDTVTQAHSAASGTSGIETVTTITATAIDSLAAGNRFRLKVTRIADDATNDTMTGDAQLVAVEVQVA